jgi:hypothetical protein
VIVFVHAINRPPRSLIQKSTPEEDQSSPISRDLMENFVPVVVWKIGLHCAPFAPWYFGKVDVRITAQPYCP